MKTPPRILANALAAILLMCPTLRATSFTWDGSAGLNGNWTVGNNWAGDIAPPLDGSADLVFSGTAGLNPNANFDWSIRSISFADNAAGFAVQGNTLTLGAGISSADDNVQTIENDLILAASQTFTTASSGSMEIKGNINTNGRVLTVAAVTDFITLGGAITGSGSLVASGNYNLVLTGDASNTYTGGTTVNGTIALAKTGGATAIPGTLVIGNPSGSASVATGFDEQIADSSGIAVNAGGAFSMGSVLGSAVTETIGALAISGGTVQINSGTLNVGSVSMSGGSVTSVAAGKLVLGGDIAVTAAGQQSSIIAGKLNLGGATRTVTVADGPAGVELEIQAAISNGSIIKAGTGRLRIEGVQSYTSLLARAGIVDLETTLGTGAASVSVSPTADSATVNFETNQRLVSLTIGNGGIVNLTASAAASDSHDGGEAMAFADEFASFAQNGAAQSVPEPSVGILISASAAAFAARRRRK